ncbi:hypothetical protein [Kineosporia sp. A_224]|uniref:hypothetical protein n=1 Tax=Kineosporia sp. A_224 TaxID=1962180 RepID=UPI000B4BAC9B|nr:hypothetical protein [Kineosporia sp. A_224]
MAASITTTCPRCGTVVLEREDLLLVVDRWADVSWYQFDCVGCARRIVKEAPEPVVSALSFADVPSFSVPAEVYERRDGAGRPVTDRLGADDLLDAVLLLAGTDDVVALATASS